MQITCKQCGGEIPAEHINLDRLVAKCAECNAVFKFSDPSQKERTEQPTEKPEAPVSPDIKVKNLGRHGIELQIPRRRNKPPTMFLLIFCLMWGGTTVFRWMSTLFRGDWIGLLKALPIEGLFAFLPIYILLAFSLNRPVIKLSRQKLAVKRRPFPTLGKRLRTKEIDQLYCKEHLVHRGREARPFTTCELYAVTSDGKHKKLLSNLDEANALFIEQEIENYLGIKDRPIEVRGEVDR